MTSIVIPLSVDASGGSGPGEHCTRIYPEPERAAVERIINGEVFEFRVCRATNTHPKKVHIFGEGPGSYGLRDIIDNDHFCRTCVLASAAH